MVAIMRIAIMRIAIVPWYDHVALGRDLRDRGVGKHVPPVLKEEKKKRKKERGKKRGIYLWGQGGRVSGTGTAGTGNIELYFE